MNIRLVLHQDTIPLPATVQQLNLIDATRTELAVILALTSQSYSSVSSLSQAIGTSDEDTFEALLRLQELDIVSLSSKKTNSHLTNDTPEVKKPKEKKLHRANELPTFTTMETAQILEGSPNIAQLMEMIEQIVGHIMTTAERNVVIGFIDYLSLEADYILLLVSHFASRGHNQLTYIEKAAIDFVNQGITTYAKLENYFLQLDEVYRDENRIRSLFGIDQRELTDFEKNCLLTWIGDWHFSLEMIQKARDSQVNAKGGNPTFAYVNTILNDWHVKGYKEPGDIPTKKKKSSTESTFDTNDFFEAALRNTYESEKK